MGIHGLDILIQLDPPGLTPQDRELIYKQQLIEKHRRGEHPYGFMDDDCTLCQLDK